MSKKAKGSKKNTKLDLDESQMSIQQIATERAQAQEEAGVKDNLSSLIFADSTISAVIDKVMHIQYMKELEAKTLPYVIAQTNVQCLMCFDITALVSDTKKDDYYISQACQDEEEFEPQNPANDTHITAQDRVVQRAKPQSPTNDERHSPELKLTDLDVDLSYSQKKPKIKVKGFKKHGSVTKESFELQSPAITVLSSKNHNKTGYPKAVPRPDQQMAEKDLMQNTGSNQFYGWSNENKGATGTLGMKKGSMAHLSSNDSIALRRKASNTQLTMNKTNATLAEAAQHAHWQSQVVHIDWVPPTHEEDDDDGLQKKLAELRTEVQKRDVQRKFEAFQQQEMKQVSKAQALAPTGNDNRSGRGAGGLMTTDHHGKIIQIKPHKAHLMMPTQTEVTISKEEVQRNLVDREIRFSENQNERRRVTKENSKMTAASKPSEYDDAASGKTLNHDDSKEIIAGQDVATILGGTVTSNFKAKREDKVFTESQTVDYHRSIKITEMELGDGVSVNGQKKNMGSVQNRQKAGLSNVGSNSVLNKLNAYSYLSPYSQKNVPADIVSFNSNDMVNLTSPNAQDFAAISPNSVAGRYYGMGNFASEHQLSGLHGTDDTLLSQSLSQTGRSRYNLGGKSKSQMRVYKGIGRIHQNNPSEAASYVADELQEAFNRAVSRNEQINDSLHDISVATPLDQSPFHNRKSSISRLLGKQQSEMRLADQYNTKQTQKNSLTSSLLEKKAMNLRSSNQMKVSNSRSVLRKHQESLQGIADPRAIVMSQGVNHGLATPSNHESSFSYLPNINSGQRNKNGQSVEINAGQRRRYGGYPQTGKKQPLLMSNYRRLANGIVEKPAGGIRLVDPARARELVGLGNQQKMLRKSFNQFHGSSVKSNASSNQMKNPSIHDLSSQEITNR